MGFIFVTVLIDVIGWGLIIPVMPNLIAGSETYSSKSGQHRWRMVTIRLCIDAICLRTYYWEI